MTRAGSSATEEQISAAEHLSSLNDALARWVQSVGPIDADDAHLPVTASGPLEWISFAVTSRQLSRASSLAIYHRLVAQLGGTITAERVISTDEQTLREALTALDRRDGLITPKDAEQRSMPWHPYRSYATAYLWGHVWEHHLAAAERTSH